MKIRAERPEDQAGVFAVNEAAFETELEARLAVLLREQASPLVSLVADDSFGIIGHIMFSPVMISGHPTLKMMGLGPMAVMPEAQRRGIGTALVHAGLSECAQLGYRAVVVLGHPEFYRRFGFHTAACKGIGCEYEVPEEAFMLLELETGYLQDVSGRVEYHPAFTSVTELTNAKARSQQDSQ